MLYLGPASEEASLNVQKVYYFVPGGLLVWLFILGLGRATENMETQTVHSSSLYTPYSITDN